LTVQAGSLGAVHGLQMCHLQILSPPTGRGDASEWWVIRVIQGGLDCRKEKHCRNSRNKKNTKLNKLRWSFLSTTTAAKRGGSRGAKGHFKVWRKATGKILVNWGHGEGGTRIPNEIVWENGNSERMSTGGVNPPTNWTSTSQRKTT